MPTKLTPQEKTALKAAGFLPQRQEGYCSCRIVTKNGVNTSEELIAISQIAQSFAKGYVNYTSRMTVEIPWIPVEKVPEVKEALDKEGLLYGGTGALVRPVTSCKGTVCVFGLVDTQAVCKKIHDHFYEGWHTTSLPHKFKIGVGGCPNNCIKPSLNDVGLIGASHPKVVEENCKNCKTCQAVKICPTGAITYQEGQIPQLNEDLCIQCGLCISRCSFGMFQEKKKGFRIFLGGRWGKAYRLGTRVPGMFSEEQAFGLIENALNFYRTEGNPKERFGDLLDRYGVDEALKTITTGLGDTTI